MLKMKLDSKGQSMVEYGLILSLVTIVSLVSLGMLGATLQASFATTVGAILAAF